MQRQSEWTSSVMGSHNQHLVFLQKSYMRNVTDNCYYLLAPIYFQDDSSITLQSFEMYLQMKVGTFVVLYHCSLVGTAL